MVPNGLKSGRRRWVDGLALISLARLPSLVRSFTYRLTRSQASKTAGSLIMNIVGLLAIFHDAHLSRLNEGETKGVIAETTLFHQALGSLGIDVSISGEMSRHKNASIAGGSLLLILTNHMSSFVLMNDSRRLNNN